MEGETIIAVITALGGLALAVATAAEKLAKSHRNYRGPYARALNIIADLRVHFSKRGQWDDVPDMLRERVDKELGE